MDPGTRLGVFFVGRVPRSATDGDLATLAQAYGTAAQVKMAQGGGKGWVRLADPQQLEGLLADFSLLPPKIRGQEVVVERPRTVPADLMGDAPPARDGGRGRGGGSRNHGRAARSAGRGRDAAPPLLGDEDILGDADVPLGSTARGRILYFTVTEDPSRRLSVHILDKVLALAGRPEKILIRKLQSGGADGWVQMETPEDCRAVMRFSGRTIHRGEMLIKLEPSPRDTLVIRVNNDISWDYLQDLPSTMAAAGGGARGVPRTDHVREEAPPTAEYQPQARGRPPRLVGEYPDAKRRRTGDAGMQSAAPGCVVDVLGLHAGDCPKVQQRAFTAFNLRNLVMVYGDVIRLQVMRQGDGSYMARLQFRNNEHASNAIRCLDGCALFGTSLRVVWSTEDSVAQPPAQGSADEFGDWSATRDHRFGPGNAGGRLAAARKPSNVLFLHNLPSTPGFTNAQLLDLFSPYGCTNAEVFKDKPHDARVAFHTLEEAAEALVWTQGCTEIAGTRFTDARGMELSLEVSFSDRPIRQRYRN